MGSFVFVCEPMTMCLHCVLLCFLTTSHLLPKHSSTHLVVHCLPLLEAVLQGRLPEEPRSGRAVVHELVHTVEVREQAGDLHGKLAAVLGDARGLADEHLLDHVLDSLQLALHTLGLHLQELAGLQGGDAFEDLLVAGLGEHRACLRHEVQDMLQDPLLALRAHLLDEEAHLVVEGLVECEKGVREGSSPWP